MFEDRKTIFALATPPGKSGVAIIRISGEKAFICLDHLIAGSKPKPRYASLHTLIDHSTNQIIDKAIILTFLAEHSFTGENIVELHIHGSRAVINILMKFLGKIDDFRLANPGEFAKRAFLNGKMDLTAAEGLADLIEAETLIQQQQAMRQVQGKLADLYEQWRKKLISVLALVEAFLDFPEDDLPSDIIAELNNEVGTLKFDINAHLNDKHKGEILRRGIYVAIIGAPNVGKSSLLNYLAKKDVAIVSNIAGTTRDVIEVNLDLDGYPVTIADTAGIRESQDIIEQEGINRAIKRAENADIKIVMLAADDSSSFNQEILNMADEKAIILLNKIDKQRNSLDGALRISIEKNIGLDSFLEQLLNLVIEKFSPSADPIITRERHRYFLNNAYESLDRFNLDNPLELAAEDLRLAARSLGQIVGTIEVEQILDEIFSKFCIGK